MSKKYIDIVSIWLGLILSVPICFSQSSTQNYVHCESYKIASTSELAGLNRTPSNITEEIQYLDGLGRPIQSVIKGGSPLSKDIIQVYEYDDYGRVSKEYLPFTLNQTTNSGAYTASAVTQQSTFYSGTSKVATTPYPYSEKVYEPSPQDRVLEQSAPGASWKLGSGHTVKNQFLYNTVVDAIKKLSVDGSGNLVIGSDYAANLLTGNILEDEHAQKTKEFKDVLGNVVMKESGIIGSTKVRTYYVYDDFNNLRFVLPPQSFPSQTNYSGNTQAWLDDHAYQYKYDERQRMIYKKLPGADAIYYVYDPLNRPILEQDGNLRFQSTATAQQWKYMKYDALGRVIQTGICTLNPTNTSTAPPATTHRVSADVRITSSYFPTNYFNNFTNFYEERCAYLYTDYAFPPSAVNESYTTNFYDDYNFDCNYIMVPIIGPPYLNWLSTIQSKFNSNKGTGYTELTDQVLNLRVRGLQTASEIKVLDAAVTDATVQYNMYDAKSRPIQNIEEQGTGNIKVVNSAYNFEGKPITVQSFYTEGAISGQTHRITERYVYDPLGRVVKQYLKPGSDAEKLVAQLGYNELGQLTEKSLHNTTTTNFLQSIDYRYNIRGWLTHINNPYLMDDSTTMATSACTTYVNAKLAQLNATHAQVTAGTLTQAAGVTQIITQIINDAAAKSYGAPAADKNAAIYILRSFDDYGTSAHNNYTQLYTALLNTLTAFINNDFINNDATDIFGEELKYDEGNTELYAPAQYNGNISYVKWRTKTGVSADYEKAYGFTYDNLNRLTTAKFAMYSMPITSLGYTESNYFRWNQNVGRFNESGPTTPIDAPSPNPITYDLSGNILTLQRNGQTASTPTYNIMDNLSYLYAKGNNQLKAVNDAITTTSTALQFKDNTSIGSVASPEYFYDNNGNLKQDNNKKITSIVYNILNLPKLITFGPTAPTPGSIEFIYDATGQKLKKTVRNGSNVITSVKYYLGGAEFTGTTPVLEAIYFNEGRLTKSGANPYKYEYTLKDHLGNSRATFSDLNGDGTITVSSNVSTTEVLQETDYYPFGLQQTGIGYNLQVGTQNKYQYNGIEFADDLGLNWFDAKYRDLDPTIGRWVTMDPKYDSTISMSPYTAMNNNPIKFTDTKGDFAFVLPALPYIAAGVAALATAVYAIVTKPDLGGPTISLTMPSYLQPSQAKPVPPLTPPVSTKTTTPPTLVKPLVLPSKGTNNPRDDLKTNAGIDAAKAALKAKLIEQSGKKTATDKKEAGAIATAEKWIGERNSNKERTQTKK